MQNRFLESMKQLGLPNDGEPILAAVSGGVDSMVLLNLLYENDYSVEVAHCNYQLRGVDSDADESLVRNWCDERSIPFYLKRIETESLVKKSNASVQMVAREERYSFFEELLVANNYQAVALAQHADDRVESLLLNVLRGTGFRGLQGMPVKRGKYVRPLLTFRKAEIRKHAEKLNVRFREDASNQETYYQRNWVRLRLMPMLEAKIPHAFDMLLQLCKRVEKEQPKYESWISAESSKIKSDNLVSIDAVFNCAAPFTLLKELLQPLGFNSDMVFEVLGVLNSESGAEIQSESHRITKDRSHLVISELGINSAMPKLSFQTLNRNQFDSLITDSNVALLDADKLDESKLKLRKWKQGDRFKPLGMNCWKLLSDFFIDQKLSVPEKDKIWLLTFHENVVWIVGHRIDNRYKITEDTQKVLKVTAQY